MIVLKGGVRSQNIGLQEESQRGIAVQCNETLVRCLNIQENSEITVVTTLAKCLNLKHVYTRPDQKRERANPLPPDESPSNWRNFCLNYLP